MAKLLSTKEWDFVKLKHKAELWLCDELPEEKSLIASAYSLVLKDGKILHAELHEKERGKRVFDIPGGHLEVGETVEEGVLRETLEETGVIIENIKPLAYMKIKILDTKPDGYIYPYPISYMVYFKGDIKEELPFEGNEESHGRVWISKEQFSESHWCPQNKELLKELYK